MSISAIIFKHPGIAGLRVFDGVTAAIQAGENPAELHTVGGNLVKWPANLGPPPDDALVAQWEQERIEETDIATKKAAALKALEDKAWQDALDAALNDPNAPQAVKDYKNAKK